MKIANLVKSTVLTNARRVLAEMSVEEEKIATKSAAEKRLDAIFARHPNDANWRDFSEVVEVVFGYRPTVVPAARQNFQVIFRENKKNNGAADQTWLILSNNATGFSAINTGYFNLHQYDRLATVKEAEAFLANFEKNVPAEQFTNWIVQTLGVQVLSSL